MPMALYTQTTGHGPDLFLLYGWALHGEVWESLVPSLAASWHVIGVDLPGHGWSAATPIPGSLQDLARVVTAHASPRAIWLGWPLGGMVALHAALDFPARVAAQILTDTTPRLLQARDWPRAMAPRVRRFCRTRGIPRGGARFFARSLIPHGLRVSPWSK
ncbi:MAG: alpha/beta fold hydrolase [Gammaproteobacteria bacterium]